MEDGREAYASALELGPEVRWRPFETGGRYEANEESQDESEGGKNPGGEDEKGSIAGSCATVGGKAPNGAPHLERRMIESPWGRSEPPTNPGRFKELDLLHFKSELAGVGQCVQLSTHENPP